MAADIIKFGDALSDHRFNKAVLEARVKGQSVRAIAEDFNVTISDVEDALITMTGAASPRLREQYLKLNMERLDRLISAQHDQAMEGNYQASVIYLRTISLQSSLLGLFPPANMPPPIDEQPQMTTTDEIEAALDRIKTAKNRIIDGEVVKDENGDGA